MDTCKSCDHIMSPNPFQQCWACQTECPKCYGLIIDTRCEDCGWFQSCPQCHKKLRNALKCSNCQLDLINGKPKRKVRTTRLKGNKRVS